MTIARVRQYTFKKNPKQPADDTLVPLNEWSQTALISMPKLWNKINISDYRIFYYITRKYFTYLVFFYNYT